jgi:hypothetical protein
VQSAEEEEEDDKDHVSGDADLGALECESETKRQGRKRNRSTHSKGEKPPSKKESKRNRKPKAAKYIQSYLNGRKKIFRNILLVCSRSLITRICPLYLL